MSWIDQIQTNYTIITGDSVAYKVNWLNAKRLQEWNISEFDFPGTSGTFVKRNLPLGTKYAIEIYFQGQENQILGGTIPPVSNLDHIDIAQRFFQSANNPNYWTIEHPFYGAINVQPTSLEYDNSVLNVTKITGMVIETITNSPPITIDASSTIATQKDSVDNDISHLYTTPDGDTPHQDLIPSTTDATFLQQANQIIYNAQVAIISVASEFQGYIHAFNQANAAVNNIIADASLAMSLVNRLLTLPAMFTATLKVRMQTLGIQFQTLRQNLNSWTNPSSKNLYMCNAGTTIGAMCLSTTNLTPIDEALTAEEILGIMELIYSNWTTYLADLDVLQTLNGGGLASFIPDAETITDLNALINTTIANLYAMVLTAKQQRVYWPNQDTNLVLLTHILYGLDNADANIEELMAENSIGLNEILVIKKGRKIVYYI